MLKFSGSVRFDSAEKAPKGVISGFFGLIRKTATQGNRHEILEHFKSYFANAAGTAAGRSSNASWAETDLRSYMDQAPEYAPLFIEAFCDACESLRQSNSDLEVPDVSSMNRVLAENEGAYEVRPPGLVTCAQQSPVAVHDRAESLDEQALEVIQKAQKDSEQLPSAGMHRQAVQEILWLLETVATAFQGLESGFGTVWGDRNIPGAWPSL